MSTTNYIFYQLISTEFVKKKLIKILITISANILSFQVSGMVSRVISIHPIVDPISEIALSIICSLNIQRFYNFLKRYTPEYREFAIYLLENYTFENYLYWKKIIVLKVCGYICILLQFMEITNWLIYRYIFQYLICFIIVEQVENGWTVKNLLWRKSHPRPNVIKNNKEVKMIDSYCNEYKL